MNWKRRSQLRMEARYDIGELLEGASPDTEFLAKMALALCREDASILADTIPSWERHVRNARRVIWSGWAVAVSLTATAGFLVHMAPAFELYGRLLCAALALVFAVVAVYAVLDTRKWRREARFRSSVRDALIRMREEKEGAR